jgi:hypothetical protein
MSKKLHTTPVCGHALTARQVAAIRALRKLRRPVTVPYIADEMEGTTDAELHGILNQLARLGGLVTKEVREVGDSRPAFWWLTDEAIAFVDANPTQ